MNIFSAHVGFSYSLVYQACFSTKQILWLLGDYITLISLFHFHVLTFYSLINPLQFGFCFCHASLLLPSLLMSLLLNPTNKWLSSDYWPSQLYSLELSILSYSCFPWHCILVILLFPAWPPFPTNLPLKVDISPNDVSTNFSLGFILFLLAFITNFMPMTYKFMCATHASSMS